MWLCCLQSLFRGLDRCFTVILLLGGQVALPPIAVTEVALGGISQYKLSLVILLLGGQVALPPIAVTEVALGGISQYKLVSDIMTMAQH